MTAFSLINNLKHSPFGLLPEIKILNSLLSNTYPKFQEAFIGAGLKGQPDISVDTFRFYLKILPDHVSLVLFVEVWICALAYSEGFYKRLTFKSSGAVVEKPAFMTEFPL